MAERARTKDEVKKLVANVHKKGLTGSLLSILIDLLWRSKTPSRTSGFYTAGAPDSIIAFDNATRIFSIAPHNPNVLNWRPRFGFYFGKDEVSFLRKYESENIVLPAEEGLFAVYYDISDDVRLQKLTYTKNPTDAELRKVYERKTLVSVIYWDATNGKALCFGDDRHGSEVNPQQHWIKHKTEFAKRNNDGGLKLANYTIDGDGTSDNDVSYQVTAGKIWHDDFLINIPAATTNIPVMYFDNGLPRMVTNTVPVLLSGSLAYNAGGTTITAVETGKVCMYHVFATNDTLQGQHIVAVAGRSQYDTLAAAFQGIENELVDIRSDMPQQCLMLVLTLVYYADETFTNTAKARMVSVLEQNNHNPVTIAPESKPYLEINKQQELALNINTIIADSTMRETPVGVVDGVNKIFMLTEMPVAETELVFMQGQLRYPEMSYVMNKMAIMFVDAPYARTTLFVRYNKQLSTTPPPEINTVFDSGTDGAVGVINEPDAVSFRILEGEDEFTVDNLGNITFVATPPADTGIEYALTVQSNTSTIHKAIVSVSSISDVIINSLNIVSDSVDTVRGDLGLSVIDTLLDEINGEVPENMIDYTIVLMLDELADSDNTIPGDVSETEIATYVDVINGEII